MSKFIYDEVTFYRLIYVFELWETRIKRKNASKDEQIVSLRKERIIEAYNEITRYSRNIFEDESVDLRQKNTAKTYKHKR